MKIQSVLKLVPISDIKINITERQRKSEPPSAASCFQLALGIASAGLLHNIGLREDTGELLFGERRFTAFKLLSTGSPDLTEEQNAELRTVAAANPLYEKWTKIPCRLVSGVDKIQSSALQFIENACREDLPLQDRAQAAWTVHLACLEALRERNRALPEGAMPERWDDYQTAALLGLARSVFSELVNPLRKIEQAPAALQPKLRQVLAGSTSVGAAKNAVNTLLERHGESTSAGLGIDPEAATFRARPIVQPPAPSESPIICADFTKWAPQYQGEPFNFIHCDFPYGIEFNKSGGQNTSAVARLDGAYDDSADVYWALLQTLVDNRARLLAPSAHIMFWFSQNLRRETEDFFTQHWPEATVSKFLLIWHCSDNSGLLPTPREGRRTYETAMQITLGDRPLAGAKAMSFSHPRGEEKIHRSQKPLAVLSHFMSMYVDSSSTVLDPTAGSATSIITARHLGAKSALGLEINPEMAVQAQKFYQENSK